MTSYRAKRYFTEVRNNLMPGIEPIRLWSTSLTARSIRASTRTGDTYEHMTRREVLKILDGEDFEPLFEVAALPVPSVLAFFGRKRDGVTVTVLFSCGTLKNAILQSRRIADRSSAEFSSRSLLLEHADFLGTVGTDSTGYAVWIDATYGLRHRLEFLYQLPGVPSRLWWAKSVSLGWKRYGPLLVTEEESAHPSVRSSLTRKRNAMMPTDWQDLLDVDGKRTLEDALMGRGGE